MTTISSTHGPSATTAAVAPSSSGVGPVVVMENKTGAFTSKQMSDATKELNRREYQAFGHLAGDASLPGIVKFAKAYLAYYKTLTPQEAESTAYKGSDTDVARLLQQAESALKTEKSAAGPGTREVKDAFSLFLEAYQRRFPDPSAKQAPASHAGDKVTLSEQALRYSVQGQGLALPHATPLAKRYSA